MTEIDFNELTRRFVNERGSVTHIMEAAAAVANALQLGMGPMIRGTFMEQDLRNALRLRDGEAVNFKRSKSQQKRLDAQQGSSQGKSGDSSG